VYEGKKWNHRKGREVENLISNERENRNQTGIGGMVGRENMEKFGASLGGSTELMSVLFFSFCFVFRAFLLSRKELSSHNSIHNFTFCNSKYISMEKKYIHINFLTFYTHTHTPLKCLNQKFRKKVSVKK